MPKFHLVPAPEYDYDCRHARTFPVTRPGKLTAFGKHVAFSQGQFTVDGFESSPYVSDGTVDERGTTVMGPFPLTTVDHLSVLGRWRQAEPGSASSGHEIP